MVQPWVARREGDIELCTLEHLHPGLVHHPSAAGRFERQAALTVHLDHPNVVVTKAAGLEAGLFSVATELLLGTTLNRLLETLKRKGERLPLPIFGAMAVRILRGLAHAHAAHDPSGRPLNIVHRNLNPHSVKLGFAGDIKLGDFFAARADIGHFQTRPGLGVGAVAYMSPEQVLAETVDHRSDVYAVSLLLYEMLGGRRAVPGGPLADMVRVIARDTPVALNELRSDLPSRLIQAVHRGLAKAPDQRWPSASAYLKALDDGLASAPIARRNDLSAYVRRCLPSEEAATVARLRRVRALSAESARSGPLAETVTEVDEGLEVVTAPGEDPLEPSVITMPGPPAVAVTPSPRPTPRAPVRSPPRRRRASLSPVWFALSLLLAVLAFVWAQEGGRPPDAPARASDSPSVPVSAAPQAVSPQSQETGSEQKVEVPGGGPDHER